MTTIRAGYCYVLKNAGLPGCCKIGRTIREVGLRKAELWKEYGTLEPFVEVSRHMVSDCVAVETMVHRKLKDRRVPKSELFRCSEKEAQATIMWAAREVLGRSWLRRRWDALILPRPKRSPKSWRRARHALSPELIALLVLALAVIGLIVWKPAIPDWLPDAAVRAGVWIEALPVQMGR